MTQRDLDEAVARLRAASSRNDPAAAGLHSDTGPPRGRPEAAGVGPSAPDIIDARAHPGGGGDGASAIDALRSRPELQEPRPARAVGPRDAVPGHPATIRAPVSPEMRARAEAQLRAAAQPDAASRPAATPAHARDVVAPVHARDRIAPLTHAEAGHGPAFDALDHQRPSVRDGAGDAAGLPADNWAEGDAPAAVRAPRIAKPGWLARLRMDRPRPGGLRKTKRSTERHQPLTAKEQRWQRRRQRRVFEEILGWILVPVILVGVYLAFVWGLSLFGYTLDDLVDGIAEVWRALR